MRGKPAILFGSISWLPIGVSFQKDGVQYIPMMEHVFTLEAWNPEAPQLFLEADTAFDFQADPNARPNSWRMRHDYKTPQKFANVGALEEAKKVSAEMALGALRM